MSSKEGPPAHSSQTKLWEEGFTLAETLVAVLVFTLMTAGAAIGVRTIVKTVDGIRQENRCFQEILLFEKVLSEQTQRIAIPWFSRLDETAFNFTESAEIRLPFVDGNGELELIIATEAGGLLLQYPAEEKTTESLVFRELSYSEAGLVIISGRPAGIGLTISCSGENHAVTGLFGAIPLQRGDNE